MPITETKDDHGLAQAQCQLESIKELVAGLDAVTPKGEPDDNERDAARERITEDVLSVEVREGWHIPGEKGELAEYNILLCTGGPAVRIIGELNQYCQPESAKLQYQDWFTPWTDYRLESGDETALLTYAEQFYYGE